MASWGQIAAQSQQLVQFVSAGRVPIWQIFRHLSQALHAFVLYTLKMENLFSVSSIPPIGQAYPEAVSLLIH